jgi:hypothetical protein
MRTGEKVVILKIHNKTEKDGKYVYRCDVGDSIQNLDYKQGCWELFCHNDVCIITNLELAEAQWNENGDLYISNVTNPEKSIIKVLDFCYERRTIRNKDGSYQKTRKGTTKYKEFFCIYDCMFCEKRSKSLSMIIRDLEGKVKQYKKDLKELRAKNRQLMKQNYEYRRYRRLKKPTVKDELDMLVGFDQQREEYNEFEEVIFEDI